MGIAASIARAGGLGGLLLLGGCEPEETAKSEPQLPAAVPAAGSGGEPAAPVAGRDTAADEAALLKLEQDYARALIARDRDFLMRFYAPDWRGGNWMGFWTKSTMLRSVLEADYVVKSMTLRNVKVRVIGDVGIVQGLDEEVTSVRGRDTSGTWTFTDVFARRDGRWVAVASHTSEVKPEAR